jgi:transposase
MKRRKNYTSDQKAQIVRRHLIDKIPVSDLCDDLELKPTVFYRWQKEFFEHGAASDTARKSS